MISVIIARLLELAHAGGVPWKVRDVDSATESVAGLRPPSTIYVTSGLKPLRWWSMAGPFYLCDM